VGADNFNHLRSLDIPLLLAVFAEDDAASVEAFTSMAESAGLNDFVLGMTHNLGLLDLGDRKPPLVAVFNALDELQPTYMGPNDPLQVVVTARKASFPLIGRLEFSRLPEYMKVC